MRHATLSLSLLLCATAFCDDKAPVKKKFLSPLRDSKGQVIPWKPTAGFGANGTHSGEDQEVPEGTAVCAVADGWLVYSYVSPSGGGTVGLMHQIVPKKFIFSMYHHIQPNRSFPVQFQPQKMTFLKQGSLLGHVAKAKTRFGGETNPFTHLHCGINLDIGNQVASGVWKEPFWGVFRTEGPNSQLHFIALSELLDSEDALKHANQEKDGRTKDPSGHMAERERAANAKK